MTTNFQQLVARAHAQAEEFGLRYHHALSYAIFMAHQFPHEIETPSNYAGQMADRFKQGTTTTDFDTDNLRWLAYAEAHSMICNGILGNYLNKEW